MLWLYLGFIGLILGLLALDLGVFHRKAHVVHVKEALAWSAFWISLGLAFGAFIYFGYEHHWLGLGTRPDALTTPTVLADGTTIYNDGASALMKYITGFVVEKSLAVDNIFVIAMIFAFVRVPAIYQHRVLFWGIVGALLMRGVMIGVGAVLIAKFNWILYVFGGFLILTGLKMLRPEGAPPDFDRSWVVRFIRRLVPITERFHGEHFVVRAGEPAAAEPATPGATPVPDRVVEAARRGTPPGDAAAGRAGAGGADRRPVRGRLDPGDLRDHHRPVHRVHQQRVRAARAALALLRAGRHDRALPLPQALARVRAHGHRHQDALPHPAARLAGRQLHAVRARARRRDPRRRRGRVAAAPAAAGRPRLTA
ncbi:MAG: hypothetical protein R2939_16420 [Kofleriaceae bacterium]